MLRKCSLASRNSFLSDYTNFKIFRICFINI